MTIVIENLVKTYVMESVSVEAVIMSRVFSSRPALRFSPEAS